MGIRVSHAAARLWAGARLIAGTPALLATAVGLLALPSGWVFADRSAGQASASSKPPARPAPTPADNSRCFVCHANYDSEEEKLTFVHARAGVGCVRCHGESSPHSSDEDGLTPPDRMFAKSRIRFLCLGCHDWVALVASDKRRGAGADLKDKPDHQVVLDGTAPDKKFCTDCHGTEHRLSHRTRLWDKKTGQLISKDATPRMVTEPLSSGP